MADFRLRRADEERDWRALRMLLPTSIHHGCGCEAFVATDDPASRRVIGAGAVAPLMRTSPLHGPKVDVHVIEPWRGRGVGRALVAAAEQAASARRAQAIYAWNRVKPDSPAARGWRSLGFDNAIECPLNRVEARRALEVLEPLMERIRKRRRIPADANIVGIDAVDLDQFVELVTTHLAGVGAEREYRDRLTGAHPAAFDHRTSCALVLGGRVVGAMLGRPASENVMWVEEQVLHPSVRGGWANIWLKLEAARRAASLGYKAFVYETYHEHDDTAKMTRRLGGVIVPQVELYRVISRSHQ